MGAIWSLVKTLIAMPPEPGSKKFPVAVAKPKIVGSVNTVGSVGSVVLMEVAKDSAVNEPLEWSKLSNASESLVSSKV